MIWDKLKIIYKGKPIRCLSYEALITKTIEQLYNSEIKNSLWIGVEKEEELIFSIIYYSILKYKENLIDEENCISKYLETEDVVVYKGARQIYKGTTIIDGIKRYKFESKEGMVTSIPEKALYMITPYCGDATTINSGKAHKVKEKIDKEIIADIFNIDIRTLKGYIKNKILIIYENKKFLEEIIDNLYIEYKDTKYLFSSIFPCVYCSNSDSFIYYKGNKTKDEPLVLFSTNLEVSNSLVSHNKNIKDVFIIGGNLIKDRMEGVVGRICKRKSIKKAILMDEWFSKLNFNEVLQSDLNFDIYAYSKSVILNNVNLQDKRDYINESLLVEETSKKINNFVDSKIKWLIANESIDSILIEIIKKLKPLKEITFNKNQMFIIECYKLLKIFKCISIPLIYLENMNQNIKEKIEFLLTLINDEEMNNMIYGEIINNFMDIHNYYLFNNKKYDYFKSIENKPFCKIINKYDEECEYIKTKYKVKATTSMDLNDRNYRNLFISYYNDNFINKIFSSPYVVKEILVNRLEMYKYKRFNDEKLVELEGISKRNIIEEYEEIFDEKDLIEVKDDAISSITEEENEILNKEETDTIFKDFILNNIEFLVTNNSASEIVSSTKLEIKKLVLFNDEYYSLLSEYYIADVINYNKGIIEEKSINELKIGDKIIFANFGRKNKDAIDAIIDLLVEYGKISKDATEKIELNVLWKEKLLKYKEVNNLNYKELSQKVNIKTQNLISWLCGNVVAPRNSSDIKKVCDFLNDDELLNKFDEIVVASKQTRKIRTGAKKILEKLIINTTVNNSEVKDDEVVNYLQDKLGDLDNFVKILTIETIEDYSVSVSVNNANTPLLLLED